MGKRAFCVILIASFRELDIVGDCLHTYVYKYMHLRQIRGIALTKKLLVIILRVKPCGRVQNRNHLTNFPTHPQGNIPLLLSINPNRNPVLWILLWHLLLFINLRRNLRILDEPSNNLMISNHRGLELNPYSFRMAVTTTDTCVGRRGSRATCVAYRGGYDSRYGQPVRVNSPKSSVGEHGNVSCVCKVRRSSGGCRIVLDE